MALTAEKRREWYRTAKKCGTVPSVKPIHRRKAKLKMRFKGERLEQEIERTWEKLRLLILIQGESNGRR